MIRAIILMIMAAVAAAPTATLAETIVPSAVACDSRTGVIKQLAERYAESPVAIGVTQDSNVIEVLASAGGTWTIIITTPNGVACIMGAGEYWELLPAKPTGPMS